MSQPPQPGCKPQINIGVDNGNDIAGSEMLFTVVEGQGDGQVNGQVNGNDNGHGSACGQGSPRSHSGKHTPLEPKDVGMTVGYKQLYSGDEDKRGRFTWQTEVPKDLGKPAEDAESEKWAIILRRVRVYHDPKKVLALHSIAIQSPYIKDVLKDVLRGYPGVTASLKRLEFTGRSVTSLPAVLCSIEEICAKYPIVAHRFSTAGLLCVRPSPTWNRSAMRATKKLEGALFMPSCSMTYSLQNSPRWKRQWLICRRTVS